MQKRLYYKIGEACKILDIQPYVLRYWETEFPALSPGKSRSGQRVYGDKELALIRRIKVLLYEEGYTIAGAKKKLEAELTDGGVEGAAAADDAGGEAATAAAASDRGSRSARPRPPRTAPGGPRPRRWKRPASCSPCSTDRAPSGPARPTPSGLRRLFPSPRALRYSCRRPRSGRGAVW